MVTITLLDTKTKTTPMKVTKICRGNNLCTILVLACLLFSVLQIVAQPYGKGCPELISVDPNTGLFLRYSGAPFYYPATMTITTSFQNANCNTIKLKLNGASSGGNYYYGETPPYCMPSSLQGYVYFPDGSACYYLQNGILGEAPVTADCDRFTQNGCVDQLAEIAKAVLPQVSACKLWEGPCTLEGNIHRSGSVSIGTSAFSNAGIAVKGGITTEQIQICETAWCDYVFDDTFRLMPLPDVANYVRQFRHLRGCTPEASIIEEGGFIVNTETRSQQEKIEEIYLHLIGMKRRADHLTTELNAITPAPIPEKSTAIPSQQQHTSDALAIHATKAANFSINCYQINKTSGGGASDGKIGVSVTGNTTPYLLELFVIGSGVSIKTISGDCPGAFVFEDVPTGNYLIKVTDNGGIVQQCNITVQSGNVKYACELFSAPSSCRDQIMEQVKEELRDPDPCQQWSGDPCSTEGDIYRTGTAGIGTNVVRGGYSLAVFHPNLGVQSDRVRIQLCDGWCDYVFEDGYPLASLYEVESYVRQNRCLPGSVSQQEVEKEGGYKLREVKLDHQKKIEEAYLHLFDINAQLGQLEKQISIYTEN